jgi:prenyltransferase beta subunit
MRFKQPAAVALICAAAMLVAPLQAADAPQHPLTGNEINSEQQRAVELGLAALARRQDRNGSFGSGSSRHAGITSLCAMAFMQSGNLPGRGKYGPQVERALTFVMSSAQESGLIASDNFSGPMYGHGFATLFLAEVYGMTGDERVKEKLQKAIKLIQKSQNPEGGWRYQPAPVDADISATICQVMALRAARDAGIKVEKEVIDRAIEYVRKCQNADGGFSYQMNQGNGGAGGSGFARSAAGLASLYYAGVSEGKDIERALAYLNKSKPGTGMRGDAEGNYYYGQYYAVQAMFLAGGNYWSNWYPAVRSELIKRQNKTSGLWTGDNTDEYATAMALLVLQMPNRYLPVYSGKGPGS